MHFLRAFRHSIQGRLAISWTDDAAESSLELVKGLGVAEEVGIAD